MRKNLSLVILGLSLLFGSPLAAQDWVVQTGMPYPNDLHMSDDGSVMAAANYDHSVGFWRHGRLRAAIRGDVITLSPDGSLALVTDFQSELPKVSLWETATVRQRFELSFGQGGLRTAWIDHRFAVLSGKGVSIYSSEDAELLRTIKISEGQPGRVDLLVSPEHEFLAFRTMDRIMAWSLNSDAKPLDAACEYESHPNRGVTVLSGNGQMLAAACRGSKRHSLLLWNAVTGSQERFFTPGWAEWLDFDQDGQRLAAGFEESVHIYELKPEPKTNQNDELVPIFERQAKDGFFSLDLSPSGERLFVAPKRQKKNRIVHLRAGSPQIEIAGGSSLSSARFAPDGQSVWAFSGQALCQWSVTGPRVGKEPLRCAGAKPWAPAARVEVAATGRHLVSAHHDYIRSWDLETGTSEVYRGKFFALSGDGELLATGPSRGRVHIWRLAGKKRLAELFLQGNTITHFAASRTGRSFVTVAGEHLATWDENGNKLWETWELTDWYGYPVYDAELARLFVGKSDGSVAGWDLENDRALPNTPLDGAGGFMRLEWVPDSPFMWTASNTKRFAIWGAETGALLKQETIERSAASPSAVIDDDHLIVSVCRQNKLGILSFSAPEDLKVLQEQRSYVSAMEVMGNRVASGTDTGELTIWPISGQSETLVLPNPDLPLAPQPAAIHPSSNGAAAAPVMPMRHYGKITDLDWDPQRRFVAVADQGGVIWLWQANGELLAQLVSPDGSSWVVLAGDGRWQGSVPNPPGVTVWVDDQPTPLPRFSEQAEEGLLARLIAEIEQKF